MITAFCVLAEPDKLMYPYIESLKSVSHFADKIIINYAAAKEDRPEFRQFEEISYENISKLKKQVESYCNIEFVIDENWKLQKNQTYSEIRNIVQSALDSCKTGWFLKFDADNVFRKERVSEIKSLFEKKVDKLIFRRANVVTFDRVGVNTSSEDIYALNIDSLKSKNIEYKVGDIKSWCRAEISSPHETFVVSDENIIPTNYDATFFTKERLIDFWKKTEEAYSFAQQRKNRFEHMSDTEIIQSYKDYKKIKDSSLKIIKNFKHPEDSQEKINQLNSSHWGFNNFA
jgi:hypothetical protein